MEESIKYVGNLFKEKRKELGISLKEAENATSIRSGYLEAIEEGRVHEFISGVYAQGFIKQYGSFLGMDVELLKKEHPEAFFVHTEKHEFSYGIGTLEVRGSMGGGVKWLPNLLWALVSVLVLAAGWYCAKYLGIL